MKRQPKVKAIKELKTKPPKREKPKKPPLSTKELRRMVIDSSPLMIRTWRGKRLVCIRCNSQRVKLRISRYWVEDSAVTVEYKCKKCGWGAMLTLNIVSRQA